MLIFLQVGACWQHRVGSLLPPNSHQLLLHWCSHGDATHSQPVQNRKEGDVTSKTILTACQDSLACFQAILAIATIVCFLSCVAIYKQSHAPVSSYVTIEHFIKASFRNCYGFLVATVIYICCSFDSKSHQKKKTKLENFHSILLHLNPWLEHFQVHLIDF